MDFTTRWFIVSGLIALVSTVSIFGLEVAAASLMLALPPLLFGFVVAFASCLIWPEEG
jgi:hypothetical protein